jgi:CDGSH-type Zn-finger protein
MTDQDPKVKVLKDGPYLVTGSVPLSEQTIVCDADGESVAWGEGKTYPQKERYSLCRCGASETKPFCDGSHTAIGFDGTETASREPYAARAEVLSGQDVDVADVKDICAEARFCAAGRTLWHLVGEAAASEESKQVIEQACLCPSGRYVARTKAGEDIEPALQPSIGLVEDPQAGVSGPAWVRGGIPIESADGFTYEVRNRVTLCRCGGSKNKPLCDGTHCDIGFRDDSLPPIEG